MNAREQFAFAVEAQANDPDKRGRCAVHRGLHDRTEECRRFMTLAFARALGIVDPEDV